LRNEVQQNKTLVAPLSYYLLAAGVTNLAFALVGAIIYISVSPLLKVDPILIGIIIFILLQKSLIVGGVTYWLQKQSIPTTISGARVIGYYFGRLYGFLIGAFLGSKIAGWIGAIVGAIALYFVGRWIGFKVGAAISRLLDDRFLSAKTLEGQK
jgi:hypothetical protein